MVPDDSTRATKKGLLENSTNICVTTRRATAIFGAQNGKIDDSAPPLKADCGAHKGKRK